MCRMMVFDKTGFVDEQQLRAAIVQLENSLGGDGNGFVAYMKDGRVEHYKGVPPSHYNNYVFETSTREVGDIAFGAQSIAERMWSLLPNCVWMMFHTRKKSMGCIDKDNTQPFFYRGKAEDEWFAFCHNGQISRSEFHIVRSLLDIQNEEWSTWSDSRRFARCMMEVKRQYRISWIQDMQSGTSDNFIYGDKGELWLACGKDFYGKSDGFLWSSEELNNVPGTWRKINNKSLVVCVGSTVIPASTVNSEMSKVIGPITGARSYNNGDWETCDVCNTCIRHTTGRYIVCNSCMKGMDRICRLQCASCLSDITNKTGAIINDVETDINGMFLCTNCAQEMGFSIEDIEEFQQDRIHHLIKEAELDSKNKKSIVDISDINENYNQGIILPDGMG